MGQRHSSVLSPSASPSRRSAPKRQESMFYKNTNIYADVKDRLDAVEKQLAFVLDAVYRQAKESTGNWATPKASESAALK